MPSFHQRGDLLQAAARDRIVVEGSFRPNGNGTIDNANNTGSTLWTVARSNTGLYVITFTSGAAGVDVDLLDSLSVSVELASAAAGTVSWLRTSADNTVTLQYYQESTGTLAAADISSNAGNRVHFVAYFRLDPSVRG